MKKLFQPSTNLFVGCPEDQFADLAAHWTRYEAADQTVLYEPGQVGDVLFGIVEGQVLIYEGERDQVLQTLGAGAFFGEMEMLGLSLVGLTAVTRGDAVLYVLSHADVLAWQAAVGR